MFVRELVKFSGGDFMAWWYVCSGYDDRKVFFDFYSAIFSGGGCRLFIIFEGDSVVYCYHNHPTGGLAWVGRSFLMVFTIAMMDLVIEEELLEFGFFVNDVGGAFHSIVLIVWLSTSFELFHHYSPDFFLWWLYI